MYSLVMELYTTHNIILRGKTFSVCVEYYGVRVSGQIEGIIAINMVSS